MVMHCCSIHLCGMNIKSPAPNPPTHDTTPYPSNTHRRKGWKTGTKITYEKEGDELPGVVPADIVFILNIKPHPR